MFEKIEEKVNAAMTTQVSTTNNDGSPAAPTAAPAIPSNNGDDLAGQLAKATAEIETLKSEHAREATEREAAVAKAKLEVATKIAQTPATKIHCTQQDIALDKAIAKVGGRAYWAKLSPAQQAEALGVQGADTPLRTVKQYFGPGSDSAAANRLGNANPAEYKRLRGLAKINGIL